jgi:hypothetical protein
LWLTKKGRTFNFSPSSFFIGALGVGSGIRDSGSGIRNPGWIKIRIRDSG